MGSVAGCILLRAALEPFGQFYYLPMVPAAVVTALLTRAAPTALAIGLGIMTNVLLVPREGVIDTIANASLFLVISWLLAELCWAQRRVYRQSASLQRALAGRDAVLDTVLAAVPVVILDREGRVRRLTPAAASLFGVTNAEAKGSPFADVVEDFDLHRLESAASSGPLESPAGEWKGRRPDGRTVLLSLQMGVVPEGGGDDHVAVCISDVTHVRAATARARELDAQLNRVWRLNSLGQMAATLAHELNQPLSAAASYMHASQRDMARAGPLGESAGRTLELAKMQVLRAGEIIRRMRDLLATGGAPLERQRVSSMIDDLQPSLVLLGRDLGMEVRVEVDPRADAVMAERIQFQQAVLNLVRNAIEAASSKQEPVVIVSGRRTQDGYVVSVEDNGPGVPANDIDSVVGPARSGKSNGMGLGLSVTRTIVDAHGGALVVGRSRLGGAAFSIHLPLEEEAA
ncbi:ATP-binding protein [Phenylobacterium sp.]|uniref:two-component system sensor histidine kinase NtrB n=1 Tax=Phenylobacterium sp. TaxID=1871053 RepID=UPI002811098C|nr:ATP-binding protein [Phenylobacterium sp.]